MKKSVFKIILIILPFLILLLFFNRNNHIPTSQTIIDRISQLPNLKDLLVDDLNEVRETFNSIPYAFNFQNWSFPQFDASSMGAFFGSIGAFFSAFGSNLANTFTSLFSGLGAFFNAIGSLLKCLGSTIVNIINYLFGLIGIFFN